MRSTKQREDSVAPVVHAVVREAFVVTVVRVATREVSVAPVVHVVVKEAFVVMVVLVGIRGVFVAPVVHAVVKEAFVAMPALVATREVSEATVVLVVTRGRSSLDFLIPSWPEYCAELDSGAIMASFFLSFLERKFSQCIV